MGPPLSRLPWSADFIVQNLEILAVGLHEGELFWLKPVHAASLRVGLPATAKPGDFVVEVMGWYPLSPIVVHSTSWRYEQGRVVLTYVAAVRHPDALPPGSLEVRPVVRAEIARGGSMAPPEEIGVAAVLEHALRHLSWLVRDDPAIAGALAGWTPVLDAYQPEPFRALA